jgi:SSS family solute:Na+ symporter
MLGIQENFMDFQWLDWFVIVGYIIFVFILAFKAAESVHHEDGSNTKLIAEEQYLAGKSLTFTESICSIIATEVSALTFLGIPAFAFKTDFSFVQIYFGAIVGRLIIALVFLPKVYDKGLTVYEVMAKETGLPSGQRTVAIFYSVAKILAVGVRLFSGAILVAQFLKWDMYLGLALVTFMTFVYTLIGGLKAVVRTDILQMGIFVSGGILAHIMIPLVSGQEWGEMMSAAHIAGKTSFFNFENPLPFFFGVMGGILFDMATHGVDQDFAQRLIANSSLKRAQQAIFFSSFISIAVGLLFLGVGALLWTHYRDIGLPVGVASADHLFSFFIVNHFPVGIKGFMVAGVMAATMSTLDSTINALCATMYNDILPKRKAENVKRNSYIDNVIITVLLFVVAVISSKNDGLLLLGLKVQSWTAGSLLGLFLTKIVLKKWFNYALTPISVIGAYAFGTFGVYMNSFVLNWDWNLNVYWGCCLSMIFLKIYSTLRPLQKAKPVP